MTQGTQKTRTLISLAATLLIVTTLILAGGPAAAVQVNLTNPGTVQHGKTKTINLNIDIEKPDKYVPFQDIDINVGPKTATFDLDGNRTNGTQGITLTQKKGWGTRNYGYGYDADGYNYGYGYGYGTPGNKTHVTFQLKIDTDKLNLDPGTYDVQAIINADGTTFPSSTKTLTIKAPPEEDEDDEGDGDGGGGRGGRGGAPPSPGDGTVKKIYTRYTVITLNPGQPADVNLPSDAPVQNLRITANTQVFDPSFSVGEHDQQPGTVDTPTGTVHSYISITTSLRDNDIDSVDIEFTIPSGWFTDTGISPGDIVLSRWHDGEWQDLDTEIVSQNGEVTFSASSPGFSVFAIKAETPQVTRTATPTPTEPGEGPGVTPGEGEEGGEGRPGAVPVEDTPIPGFGAGISIAGILGTLYVVRRRQG